MSMQLMTRQRPTLVLAALVMFAGAAIYSGNETIGERSLVLAGAVLGFLWYNLRMPWRPQAALFMGNAGSAFLGFAIATKRRYFGAFFTQPVDGRFKIAIGFCKCLAAVHHTCTCSLAQLINILSCNSCC